MIASVGDSKTILGTRDLNNVIVSMQLIIEHSANLEETIIKLQS